MSTQSATVRSLAPVVDPHLGRVGRPGRTVLRGWAARVLTQRHLGLPRRGRSDRVLQQRRQAHAIQRLADRRRQPGEPDGGRENVNELYHGRGALAGGLRQPRGRDNQRDARARLPIRELLPLAVLSEVPAVAACKRFSPRQAELANPTGRRNTVIVVQWGEGRCAPHSECRRISVFGVAFKVSSSSRTRPIWLSTHDTKEMRCRWVRQGYIISLVPRGCRTCPPTTPPRSSSAGSTGPSRSASGGTGRRPVADNNDH